MADPAARRWTAVRRAAALLAVEALALAGLGAAYVVAAVVGEPDDRSGAVLAGVLVVGVGVGLLLIARGLAREQGWAWAPTVLLQVLLAIVAVSLLRAGDLLVAAPIAVLLVAVLYELATPEARLTYRDRA